MTANNDLIRCFVVAKHLRDEAGHRRGGALDAYVRDQSYSALDRTTASLARKLSGRVSGGTARLLGDYATSYQVRKKLCFRQIPDLA